MNYDGSEQTFLPQIIHHEYEILFKLHEIIIRSPMNGGYFICNKVSYYFTAYIKEWDPVLRPPGTNDWDFIRDWNYPGTIKLDQNSAKIDHYWGRERYSLTRSGSYSNPTSSAYKKFLKHIKEYVAVASKEQWFADHSRLGGLIELNNQLYDANAAMKKTFKELHWRTEKIAELRNKIYMEQNA